MGSSCSSAQKKKDKRKQKESQSPVNGNRRRSAESLPYGKSSPSNSRRPSSEPIPASAASQSTEAPITVTKTPLNATLSQTSSTAGGGSSSSPPAGMVDTPVSKDAPQVNMDGLPDMQQFSEQVKSLIMGRMDIQGETMQPKLQEIMLYLSADFTDSRTEQDSLIEKVYPSLRKYTAEKGYELNIVDLHFGAPNCAIFDHSMKDICLDILREWKSKKRLLTLVLFNDNLGEPLLPNSVAKPHFESFLEALSSEEQKELFLKWYSLDENASPPAYVLKTVISLLPDITSSESEKRKQAFADYSTEYEKMLTILKENLPDTQRNKYLLSVLEEEIKMLVATDESQDSRRALWMQRRFTHVTKNSTGSSQDSRRIDKTKIQLEDFLPDSQKLVQYVRFQEGGKITPESDEEHAKYINEFCSSIKEELVKMIDGLIEEDFLEEAMTPFNGIEKPLYSELIQHHKKCMELNAKTSFPNPGLSKVQEYILGSSAKPLVIHGAEGCGKTHLVAKCVSQCSSWLPPAPVVLRFVGTTQESSSENQLLRSILEQCCVLYGEHQAFASQSIQNWSSRFEKLLEKVSEVRPLIVMIDGIDEIDMQLLWLPKELPANVKLVLTVKSDADALKQMKVNLCDDECFFELDSSTPGMSVIDRQLEICKRRVTSGQREFLNSCLETKPCIRYSQLLSLVAVQWPGTLQPEDISVEKTLGGIMHQLLINVEHLMGPVLFKTLVGLLITAKQGLSDSEMVDILSCEEDVLEYIYVNCVTSTRRFPPLLLMFFKRLLGPFLSCHVLGGKTLTTFSCTAYRTSAVAYIRKNTDHFRDFAQALADYFLGKWAEGKKKPTPNGEQKERFILEQPLVYGSYPNRRKLDELPRQMLQLDDSIRENFLFDATWLLYKFCGSDPYQFLDDIACFEKKVGATDDELKLLTSVIQLCSYALRCDGSQFFAQIYGRLRTTFSDSEASNNYPFLKVVYERACRPPLSSLLPVSSSCLTTPILSSCPNSVDVEICDQSPEFSSLHTIKGDYAHIISLSSTRGELTVWNVYEQTAVRRFTGLNQPKDVKMLDRYRALVLCNRELKVYHLDQGSLVVKLKGVMNQKMAYYGIHDENYAVSLSRNRMYVNMTNLTTGDLETTFKVGEDRFLNSLLVSANGRICVCGDETQKPFPLLVWDLTSRKLVYDLRIPHHEFVTRLSAISDDGHYVVSVCRELHGTSPNFIIVYDLQSGTLFKKWKPESSSCSIAISSQGGCVINGLENTWVLVWDLSTGARRYTLRGHSAPADEIRVDEEGKRCLTFDSLGRDRSLRVWDVCKGECVAVFTPDQAFTCCQLSLDGSAVVLGLEGCKTISTLVLCRENTIEDVIPEYEEYGDNDRKYQSFDVRKE